MKPEFLNSSLASPELSGEIQVFSGEEVVQLQSFSAEEMPQQVVTRINSKTSNSQSSDSSESSSEDFSDVEILDKKDLKEESKENIATAFSPKSEVQ